MIPISMNSLKKGIRQKAKRSFRSRVALSRLCVCVWIESVFQTRRRISDDALHLFPASTEQFATSYAIHSDDITRNMDLILFERWTLLFFFLLFVLLSSKSLG